MPESLRPGRSLLALLALALVVAPGRATAHQASVVYLELAVRGRTVAATFQISDADLGPALGPAQPGGERPVERQQVLAGAERLLAYLAERVHVDNGGGACEPEPRGVTLDDKTSGFFAVARLDYACKRTAADLTVRYDLFFDLDPRHQAFVRVLLPGEPERSHLFRSSERVLRLDRPVTLVDHLRDYFGLGVEHIFTGYDHLAFLFGLLIVIGFGSLSGGLRRVLGIVTAFTVAHSVTLLASGLDLVRLSPRLVEPAIALSIGYVAVENLATRTPRHRWLLTFGFGLVHGFGFASVLREIGLPPRGLVLSLVAFNVGIEAGQLSLVCAVAPVLWWLERRSRDGYDALVRRAGSCVLLALATYWFLERVLGRTWLGGWLG